MEKQILDFLEKEQFIELSTKWNSVNISFTRFFGTQKEFLFYLNGKPVYGCKRKSTAIKKIKGLLNKGFEPVDQI